MKITCVCCANEVNLDHKVFENYAGPVKCFRCGTMMEIKTENGALCSMVPPPPEKPTSSRKAARTRV
jgi:hypothetical protein